MEVSKYSFLNLNFLLVVIIVMISFFTSYNKKPNHLHYTETMSTPQKFEYMFSKENVNIKQYLGVNLFEFLPLLGFNLKSNSLEDDFQLVYGIDGMLLDGDDSYKVIVPLSADIKENLATIIRISYLENRGFSDGEDESKLIRDYILTQPIEKRLSVSYVLIFQKKVKLVKIKQHRPKSFTDKEQKHTYNRLEIVGTLLKMIATRLLFLMNPLILNSKERGSL